VDGETRFVTLGSLFRVFLLVVASISAGAVVGIMASLYHAAFFPWGFLAIMMALIAGLVGLRVFFRPRYPAVLASLGLIGAIAVLAGDDGQESVLIAANPPGFSLLLGVAVVLIIANAWPGVLPAPPVKMESPQPERTLTQ